MIVLIVAIAVIGKILKARYDAGTHVESDAPRDDPDAARLRDEVRTLKDRIAVLERIATDRTAGLDHEIERLRDR